MAILQSPPKHHLLSTYSTYVPKVQTFYQASISHLIFLWNISCTLTSTWYWPSLQILSCFLTLTFAYAVPRAGMLFSLFLILKKLYFYLKYHLLWKTLFFFYNLPLSVQNTSLCASIIALHLASYNSFLSLLYYNLRVRISYHLFLKFSYQYFSKCNHWSPLSESLRTLQISNAGNLHLTKPPGSFLGHIMFQKQSYSELIYCWS